MTIPLPGDLTVEPPAVPGITVEAPRPDVGVFVPVEGPRGPQGPAGDTGQTLAFVQNVSPAATTVLINHNLAFQPAGILCLDTAGDTVLGATVTYPLTGYIELQFGVPFTGIVFLS